MRISLIVVLLLCLFTAQALASGFSGTIAFELQEKGRFTGVIGKMDLTKSGLEVVTFVDDGGRIVPFAFFYNITEQKNIGNNVYQISCINQLGVKATGKIDLSSISRPKLSLVTENGITMTNITKDGLKLKEKISHHLDLGR